MEKLRNLTTPRAQLYGSLLAIVVVVLSGLAGVAMLGDKLERARAEAEETRSRRWIGSVVDGADDFSAMDLTEFSDRVGFGAPGAVAVYTVRRGGRVVATAIKSITPGGYNGAIEFALAVDRNGVVIGMRVLSHVETPGFGGVIGEGDSSWIVSFRGRSLEHPEPSRWRLRSDGGAIDGISGATITASAIVTGVFRALNYIEHRSAADEGR
jgi:H+/Na+-translocating ferredoxin:NAD+ oxidoreductase subunit G